MGFIFGLMISAAAMSGNGTTVPPMLGSIPLRCLYALDISEQEYRDCRAPSLHAELWGGGVCEYRSRLEATGNCSIARHSAWEMSALRELKKAAEAQKSQAAR